MKQEKPAVFFDLGWTLAEEFAGSWEHARLYPEAAPALRLVNEMDRFVVIASNQASIAAGRHTLAQSNELMQRLIGQLRELGAEVDASYICPHADEDRCRCRKPKTGLFEEADAKLGIDFSRSWVVGDLWRDIAAGKALGSRTVQVRTSERADLRPLDGREMPVADIVCANVLEAVEAIVGTERTVLGSSI